jgi:diguanylate cyclase (GGDEF)-like protein
MKKGQLFFLHIVPFLALEAGLLLLLHIFFAFPLYITIMISLGAVLVLAWIFNRNLFNKFLQNNPLSVLQIDTGRETNHKLQNMARMMKKQIYDLHNLFEVSINLTSILEPQQLIKSSILSLIGQLQTNQAMVFLPSKGNQNNISLIYAKGYDKKEWKNFTISLNDPIFKKFNEKMIAVDLQNVEEELLSPQWRQMMNSGISMIAPIIPKKKIKGIIAVGNKMNQEFFTRSEREIFSLLAHFISVAFSNSILYQKMEQISITDGLTGLYNYRYFKKRLEDEILRAKRYNHELSLILFDVDYFKNYNDMLGHPAGDTALKTIAQLLKTTVRKSDIAVRYGGEEFAIIVPEEGHQNALNFAERLRKLIEAFEFDQEDVQPFGKLTISLGIASFPVDAADIKTLIKKTDNALYHAKHNGRNRSCINSEAQKKKTQEMDGP